MSNTVHDMGGMHGFGPVEPEPDEPVFHEEWEGRVLALELAMDCAGLWTIDGARASFETLPPLTYLKASYYQRWLIGLEKRVVSHGLVGEDEIAAGRSLRPGRQLNRTLSVADAADVFTAGRFDRPTAAPARFRRGDRVRTRNINPVTHTRLPRYARAKLGTVEAIRGCHVHPDTAALGATDQVRGLKADGGEPQWLYTVVFPARALWGEAADPNVKVSIEAFEPYLDPA
jgi:nitrile hydratase subunit beta